ncbi:MAG: type II toxin-antitoxin system VapC family toxin [Acidobacteriota bacterium]
MIVDSCALLAILKREPEYPQMRDALATATSAKMSAASYVESGIVTDRYRNALLSQRLDEVIAEFEIAIEPLTPEQARIARQAYRIYGKGSGHPANLNFGDCFSYALARDKREPILFKGDGFIHTDLRPALEAR